MAYIYDLTDTWNAGGTTFNAIKMNVTDSASASGSKLVTLQTNGTEHFSVTKAGVGYFSGNVGIGTSSPSALLHVKLATNVNARFINAYSSVALGATTDVGAETKLTFFGNPVAFVTNDTERMRIDSSGNVGIGTSSPSNKFVVSNAGANGFEFNTTDNVFQTYNRSGAAYVDFNCYSLNHRIFTGTSPTERMRITSAGNVGIGTSSPDVKLEVASADAITSLRVDTENTGISANNYSEIALADNNAIRTWWRNVRDGSGKTAFGYNNHLAFLSDAGGTPTERMRIDASGKVGIGTSSPEAPLDIRGGNGLGVRYIETATGNTNRIQLGTGSGFGYIDATAGVGSTALVFQVASTERARIDTSGNLLVGTTSVSGTITAYGDANSQYLLGLRTSSGTGTQFYINFINSSNVSVGSITASGSTTSYNTSSDARLKENIAQADDTAALIDAIQVRKFNWKADGSHQRYGFVAQELLEVAPEAVSQPADPEEMMGVDYSKLVPMLVKEIQSLRARVAQLEGN